MGEEPGCSTDAAPDTGQCASGRTARRPETETPDAPGHVLAGEILEHGPNWFQVRVRLESGEEIEAVIPRTRRFGCLFGALIGWQVQIVIRKPPRLARVVDLHRPE